MRLSFTLTAELHGNLASHSTCNQTNTTLPNLSINRQYWRPGYLTTAIQQCPRRALCLNGSTPDATYDHFGNATCAPGRGVAGAYCQLCMDPKTHFFDVGQQRCLPCSNSVGPALASVVAVGLLLALAGAYSVMRPKKVAVMLTAVQRSLAFHASRVSFRAKLRVCISFLQVVTQMQDVYGLLFPESRMGKGWGRDGEGMGWEPGCSRVSGWGLGFPGGDVVSLVLG